MQLSQFMDQYPIYEQTILKSACRYADIDAIMAALSAQIEVHPLAKLIAQFDHYTHTQQIAGDIHPDILAARHVIFCFGTKIPNAQVLAVRPRSIGVTEFADRFVIAFLAPPMPMATETMLSWVADLQQVVECS